MACSSEVLDLEKRIENLQLEEKFGESQAGVTAGLSSAATKDEKEVMNLKNQKIEEESLVGAKHDEKKKMILLRSSEGDTFSIEESCAVLSRTIRGWIETGLETGFAEKSDDVPLPNVSTETLKKVVEVLKKHGDPEMEKEELMKWEEKFIQDLLGGDNKAIFDLVNASEFLDAQCLEGIAGRAAADFLKDKSVEYVRYFFNITNDYTEEEEAKVKGEYPWVYEGEDE